MVLADSPLSRLVFAVLILSWGACASSPELDMVLDDSWRGSVYLERIPDRSFLAAHPIKLDQETVTRVLRGVLIKEDEGLMHNLMTGQAALVPAFTDEEVRYLAPLVTDAFRRAAPDQQVGFRLIQLGSGIPRGVGAAVGSSEPPRASLLTETTKGSIYAYGRSLYITLAEFHVRPDRPDTINMANRRVPDPTGLLNRTVAFTPESAQRPDNYRGRNATDATLVIDYELLAALPVETSTPTNGGRPSPDGAPSATTAGSTDRSTDAQLQMLQEQMRQKNRELEELRKELQDIRRHLKEPSPRP